MSIVILGAGPAGLAAAHAASSDGHAVTVVDDNPAPGGQIWRGGPARWRDPRAHALWEALRQRQHVRFIQGARVVAAAGPHTLLLDTADGPRLLPWQRVILCSGARELLLPFPGWTLPGVMGVGAIQALAKGGMPLRGKRVVIAGSGPLLLAAADTVRRSGGKVVAIAEHQGTRALAGFFGRLLLGHPGKVWQSLQLAASLLGVPYRHGAVVSAAAGDQRLQSVTLRHRGREREIACDFLACGFGLVPGVELGALFGCTISEGRITVDGGQASSVKDVWAAGESTGIGGVDKALAEGRIAGLARPINVADWQPLNWSGAPAQPRLWRPCWRPRFAARRQPCATCAACLPSFAAARMCAAAQLEPHARQLALAPSCKPGPAWGHARAGCAGQRVASCLAGKRPVCASQCFLPVRPA
jgi:NADPH-dependent 2,4-dienoyl-CoA reductase/sulfur reductase-like enzyme